MREGWYLMNTRELERALGAWRNGDHEAEFGIPLAIDDALGHRNAGNIPDDDDRSLRLVLFVDGHPLEQKRLRFEPDVHAAPDWRREGSRPVNVVPLRPEGSPSGEGEPWWESARVRELEEEWRSSGAIAGVEVAADYRSFVFKTVIALQDAGEPVTPQSIGDSISRWLSPEDTRRVRESMKEKGPGI